MTKLGYQYHDGGRKAAGFRGRRMDCVIRAIAIATGKRYAAVYETLNMISEFPPNGCLRNNYAHSGIQFGIWYAYLHRLGWRWHDCDPRPYYQRRHRHRPKDFTVEDLPGGTLIVDLRVPSAADGMHHVCVVKDHVVLDNYPTNTRKVVVLGYFRKKRRIRKRKKVNRQCKRSV